MSKKEKTNQLRLLWDNFKTKPFGKWMFMKALHYHAPYTGTMKAQVEELKDNYCKVTLKDRRIVRNPFNSIHAIAQANLSELACNLALFYTLPSHVRAIVTECNTTYHKKARGLLTAECHLTLPESIDEEMDYRGECIIKDKEGDVVCRGYVGWRFRPEKKETDSRENKSPSEALATEEAVEKP